MVTKTPSLQAVRFFLFEAPVKSIVAKTLEKHFWHAALFETPVKLNVTKTDILDYNEFL